jgi:hypothetical protein
MAEQYDNTNTIAIFKADKGDNPKRPDYTGSLNCNGTDFRVSLWMKESKTGTKFLSGQIQPKEAMPGVYTTEPTKALEELESDLPF